MFNKPTMTPDNIVATRHPAVFMDTTTMGIVAQGYDPVSAAADMAKCRQVCAAAHDPTGCATCCTSTPRDRRKNCDY